MRTLNLAIVCLVCGAFAGCRDDTPRAAGNKPLARAEGDQGKVGTENLKVVAEITGPMPTGITVSKSGRVFTNFPRWGDPVEFTVAEVKGGKVVPFPDARINKLNDKDPANSLVSVQSVVVDEQDRLWILD